MSVGKPIITFQTWVPLGTKRGLSGRLNRNWEKISKEKGDEWLSVQDAYTLHRPVRVQFPWNRVFAPSPLYQFQADLCDMCQPIRTV